MGMNRMRRMCLLAISASLATWGATGSQAGQAAAQDASKPEYNSEQACFNDKNPTSQVKCLDDFVSKYPNSALLIYVYPMYYQAYRQMKNWAKVIEYADKTVALGDKIGPNDKYAALYARATAFYSLPAAEQATQAKGTIAAAETGLKLIPDLK